MTLVISSNNGVHTPEGLELESARFFGGTEAIAALQSHYPDAVVRDWDAYNGKVIRDGHLVGSFLLLEAFGEVCAGEALEPAIRIDDGEEEPFPEHVMVALRKRAKNNDEFSYAMVSNPRQRRPKKPVDVSSHPAQNMV